ncbi:unnamed protein product [Prorocentrum cordatum]|uniref:ABC transporter domain-containing protein n=1 Tax=Prorocentrum cordatum TaxID=2364126 RepID=A0ABN9V2J8_9DINO|nr:unnamed protein product [Polarella glacialis]
MASPQGDASPLFAGDAEAARSAEVEVRDLYYTIRGKKKNDVPREVLKGISCSFPSGRLSAMMGASGSGKTSLLTLMRGLSSPGSELRGGIFCNGRPVSIDLMRSISSVVPQEDVFLSALTVRETLAYAAQLRLPPGCKKADWDARVEHILALLKLGPCAEAMVGDDRLGIRGISGGERRRLSIGTAVIGGLPQLLLCDEPTSGLDSAAAHGIVAFLKSLADRGVTVLCAILAVVPDLLPVQPPAPAAGGGGRLQRQAGRRGAALRRPRGADAGEDQPGAPLHPSPRSRSAAASGRSAGGARRHGCQPCPRPRTSRAARRPGAGRAA